MVSLLLLLFLIIKVSEGVGVSFLFVFETGSHIQSWPEQHCVVRTDLELDSAASTS